MTIKYTAWLSVVDNGIGADPGISISKADVVDGYQDDKGFVAHSVNQPGWTDDDTAAAEADGVLTALGFRRTEKWIESGGQWAVDVEPIE